MKRVIYLTLVIILFSACKKETEPTNNNTQSTTSSADIFDFDFDGTHYITTDIISAGIFTGTLTSTGINDNGTTDAFDNMALSINIPNVSVGTFQLDTGLFATTYFSLQLPAPNASTQNTVLFSLFSANPGTITITDIDNTNQRIRGVFSSDMSDGDQVAPVLGSVTNGEFDVHFQQ